MKIVTFGEIMLRLSTPGNKRFVQSDSFDVVYGGGEANVAVSCANYGHEAYFVTKLPAHEIGQSAVNALRRFGVKTDYITRGGDRVGIYYLETGASMRPSKVIYDRAHSAMAEAEPGVKMTQYRWVICSMLFFATAINYLDRQVLSLTWDEFIKPEFHWSDYHYGLITSIFSVVYALCMLFAGGFVDRMGSKKGYMWAIGIWSAGACLHALCGIATEWCVCLPDAAALRAVQAGSDLAVLIATVSMYFFIAARCILAMGEAGNFPAAIKVTAEYFPKKDRAYATSIFNAGASIGALFAPLSIPPLAKLLGWEMAFVVIGALGFIWLGIWTFVYKVPSEQPRVNAAELEYINQDRTTGSDEQTEGNESRTPGISLWKALTYRQTWAFVLGKFLTDGVWWFFLFWTPSYISSQFGIKMSEGLGMALIFTLYAITMLSIYGGKLPTIIMNRTGMNPYAARMKAMLMFAFVPLLVLLAQPLGTISPWFPIVIIGLGCAAHQSWSANIFSVVGDMFPKSAVATVTGVGGMAGGIGSMIMQWFAGWLFVYAEETDMLFLGFEGKPAGYFIVFCICAFSYLAGWVVMKALVPKYKPIETN